MARETPKEATEWFAGDRMAADVWFEKYCLKSDEDVVLEKTFADSAGRWANALVGVENPDSYFANLKDSFRKDLEERLFIFGGRINYALGNKFYRASLKNCYVIPIKEDSLEAIFTCLKEMARTYSFGGGCGSAIGGLRPRGSHVNNCARISTGAVSFMEVMSQTTGTIGQEARRGAEMITLRVDHPDIYEFIDVKNDVKPEWLALARTDEGFKSWVDKRRMVRFANISVQLTDEFLEAVDGEAPFELRYKGKVYRTVDANELWDRIMERAWSSAEPGVLFWSRMQHESPSDYYGVRYAIEATNPCGEQPLEPYGNCNLGHVNLAHMVRFSFTKKAEIDLTELERVVRAGVRALDRINDLEEAENRYPLPQMRDSNIDLRRIGLGITGFGEMLIRLGIRFGSQESIAMADLVGQTIRNVAYDESCNLAQEKGPFRIFDIEKHEKVPMFQRLPKPLQEKIRKHGLRNVCILTIAPVGSGAIICQTSSGIEPFFALWYNRRVETASSSGGPKVYLHKERIVEEWARVSGVDISEMGLEKLKEVLPNYFVASHEVDWTARVEIQATFQKYIDSSISSTVNIPHSATVEDVKTIYMHAWRSGCKGITVYREGCREGVLQTVEAKKKEPARAELVEPEPEFEAPPQVMEAALARLSYEPPEIMDSRRLAFRDGAGNRVLVNLGFDPESGKPMELSMNHGKTDPELDSLSKALGISVSIALQEGISPERIAKGLRGIKAGWSAWARLDHGKRRTVIASVPDAVGAFLRHYEGGLGPALESEDEAQEEELLLEIEGASECKKCFAKAVVYEEGCYKCRSCLDSKCG